MNIALLTLTVTATAAVAANRGITSLGAVPAAAAAIAGVTRTSGGIGDLVPVDVMGTTLIESGAAIAAGAAVEVDNQGRAITLAAGVKAGRMAPGQAAAGAAGVLVEIVLIPT
ncbi:MAG TPA: capsid cement protein [Albitalea sp.]|jgi:hypothetical protein|nr:capsid cement protein [Albitalea sp.]